MATTRTQITPTPLAAVLTLTFLGSLGTGAVTNGFSFIATEGLGYTRTMNLLLALVLGGSYIVGALASGPIVKRLSDRGNNATPRALLAVVLVIIGGVCFLPILAQRFAPALLELALWVLILVFSPMTGVLWPIVESYISGGRRDRALRSAVGKFNIVWSGALVVAFWGMAPLLEQRPFLILALLGVAHFLMCVLLRWFSPYPPRHLSSDHEPVPAEYSRLLTLFRVLLIASYIVLSALSPLLPVVESRMGVPVHWMTPIASAWLTSRVFVFVLLERWHGWHGRWSMPWIGLGMMLLGFAGVMLSPMLSTGVGTAFLVVALATTGCGIAITYYGALYYAMAVGNAEVDAGGKHEAMIGMGYTLGPLCGLAGVGLSGNEDDAFRYWVIVLVSAAVIGSMLIGWRLLRRSRTREIPPAPSPH